MIKISVILGLFGRSEKLIREFAEKVEELKKISNFEDLEIIIISEGIEWTYIPLYQALPIYFKNATIINLLEEKSIPSIIFNKGLEIAKGEYCYFTYAGGVDISMVIDILRRKYGPFKEDVLYIQNLNVTEIGQYESNQNRYGFLQMGRIHAIDEVIIRNSLLKQIYGFNTTTILQRDFDAELMLRLSLHTNFRILSRMAIRSNDFISYPFKKVYYSNEDFIRRYIIRCARPAFPETTFEEINRMFAEDAETSLFKDRNYKLYDNCSIKKKKYKIYILGGYWEYHHNQIVFFNYLERLYGTGFCTYRTNLEYCASVDELIGYDLVIFTRCRSNNAKKLVDYCNEKGIRTLYMIDDNWISISTDYPKEGSIFAKGKPDLDNFIYMLKHVDVVWTFNKILEDDIRQFTKKIVHFKISVEKKMFEVSNVRKKGETLLIGFSGTKRYNDVAFRALVRLAQNYKNVCILLFGILDENQKKLFENINKLEMDFESYPRYSKRMAELSPDLLVAPLGQTRTEMSKCYNKYIESGIVHSACLYSKTMPYTEIIEDGYNGYFVENETVDGWYKKLEQIISDVNQLRLVQENAFTDIVMNYTVESLLKDFVEKIIEVIEGDAI